MLYIAVSILKKLNIIAVSIVARSGLLGDMPRFLAVVPSIQFDESLSSEFQLNIFIVVGTVEQKDK